MCRYWATLGLLCSLGSALLPSGAVAEVRLVHELSTGFGSPPVFPQLGVNSIGQNNSLVVFDYITASYVYFGKQTGFRRDLELVWVTDDDMSSLCLNNEKSQRLADEKFIGKAVMFKEEHDITCGGSLGSLLDYNYLSKFCTLLRNSVIIRGNNYHFPGLWANQHDGSRFEDRLRKQPDLAECWWIEVRFHGNVGLALKEYFDEIKNDGSKNRFWVDLDIDKNRSNPVYQSSAVMIVTRVLIPFLYFYISILSFTFLLERYSQNSLLGVQGAVLTVNFVQPFILAVVESQGNKFTTANLSVQVVSFFYTTFFASTVAMDYLIVIQYRQVRQAVENLATPESLFRYKFIAAVLLCFDVFAGIGLLFTTGKSFRVAYFLLPFLYCVLQAIIIVILLQQTRLMRALLKAFEDHKHGHKVRSPLRSRGAAQLRLEKNIRFWVHGTATCAAGNLVVFLCLQTFIALHSPQAWVSVWSLLHLLKLGNLISQIKVCEPNVSETVVSFRPSSLSSIFNKPDVENYYEVVEFESQGE